MSRFAKVIGQEGVYQIRRKAKFNTSLIAEDGTIFHVPSHTVQVCSEQVVLPGGKVLTPEVETSGKATSAKSRLPVDTQFENLAHLTQVVAAGFSNSLFVAGPGGTGKTYTVREVLSRANKTEGYDYHIIQGHATSLGLYNALYEHRHSLVIFDDCDGVLKDQTGLNVLKSVLDTYPERKVAWRSSSAAVEVPEFIFRGQVIFISNLEREKIESPHLKAVLSRALTVVIGSTREEILERIVGLVPKMLKGETEDTQKEVIEFLHLNADNVRDLSLRLLVHIKSLLQYTRATGTDWRSLALSLD